MKQKIVLFFTAFLLLFFASPMVCSAASMELSKTAKKNFDSAANQTDSAAASRLRKLYSDFLASEKEGLNWDARIKTLHGANAAEESKLRKDIGQIDAVKLLQLEQQVKQTKARYQPLFDRYTALNKQIAAARVLKNSQLNLLLRIRKELLKPSTQLARQDIRLKETALKEAKTEAARKKKELRDLLDQKKPLEEKITAFKKASAGLNKSMAPPWKRLNAQVKKKDAAGMTATLSTLLSLSKQNTLNKQEMAKLEIRISELLRGLRQQLGRQ